MRSFVRQVGRLFGYDGTKSNALRKNPTSCLRSEDDELPPEKRKRLVARSRDIRRNFEIARWAINKHLDFTSDFTFRSVTGVAAFDDAVDAFMKDRMKAENCDVTGRFSLRRIMRMVEGLRTVDGDLLVVTLADGRLQLVEGDRIRDPEGVGSLGIDRSGFTQGVKLGHFGKHVAYAVHKRNGSGFTFERLLNAANAIHHGYFDRYEQIRGVSPMASSLNRLRDVYEGFDYALARSKQSQLFGIVINRKPEDDLADPPANTSEDDLAQPDEAPSFTFDPDGGPIQVDLETGEDAKFLESNTPSNEFRDFNTAMIGVALKALDLLWKGLLAAFLKGKIELLKVWDDLTSEYQKSWTETLAAVVGVFTRWGHEAKAIVHDVLAVLNEGRAAFADLIGNDEMAIAWRANVDAHEQAAFAERRGAESRGNKAQMDMLASAAAADAARPGERAKQAQEAEDALKDFNGAVFGAADAMNQRKEDEFWQREAEREKADEERRQQEADTEKQTKGVGEAAKPAVNSAAVIGTQAAQDAFVKGTTGFGRITDGEKAIVDAVKENADAINKLAEQGVVLAEGPIV